MGGYTSVGDMFDGGGAGGSGDKFSTLKHEDYIEQGGTTGGDTSFFDRITSDRFDDPNSRSMTTTPEQRRLFQNEITVALVAVVIIVVVTVAATMT